jgi:methyl-accepting chemotaxis protein
MKGSTLVERDFKLKFGLKFCLFTIVGMLSLSLFVFFVTSESLGGSYRSAIYTIYKLKINIFPLLFASFYSILILAVITAAIAVIAVLFSHKMAGPLVHIERSLEVIGSGDLTRETKLREGDQLLPIADEINSMVRSLNHRARSSRDALLEIKKWTPVLSDLLSQETPDEARVQEALRGLKAGVAGFKKSTAGLKLKADQR